MTSYDDADLQEAGYALGVTELVTQRAVQARSAGIDGLILSPLELVPIRALVGPDMLLVTPGVRPAGADAGDQKAHHDAGPGRARGGGSSGGGRPITRSPDPRSAAERIVAEIAGATPRP